MRAYYNEIDPYCVQWLKNLIAAGHIASGDVDERPIEHLTPADLKGYTQCHFFAGLGGWSRALRLAGWADERPVWTGSCPCQPYSAAGKGLGESDARNLWPVWLALIGQCRPGVVIGEQVDSAIRFGWIDGVRADLEAQDYAAWHTVLPAACAGAPQIRHRLWWVAVAESGRGRADVGAISNRSNAWLPDATGKDERWSVEQDRRSSDSRAVGGVAVADGGNACDGDEQRGRKQRFFAQDGGTGERLARAESRGLGIDGRAPGECGHVDERRTAGGVGESSGARSLPSAHDGICRGKESRRTRHVELERSSGAGGLVLPVNARLEGFAGNGGNGSESGRQRAQSDRPVAEAGASCRLPTPDSRLPSFWSQYDLIPCADGKARRVEPGTFPLAHGFPRTGGRMRAVLEGMGLDPRTVKRALRNARSLLAKAGRNRVGRLRGYGNAIEPQTAASFIELFKDVIPHS